jgi:hypothetical protein
MSKEDANKNPERWFCHYFESAQKTYSEPSGHRIANEAMALKNADGSPFFHHILTYRKKDLGAEWVEERKNHFAQATGAGYWVWKPRIIQLTLEQMEPGDTLLYADTGCEIRGQLDALFELLEQADIIPFELGGLYEKEWTKGDVFEVLNAHQFKDTPQRLASIALFRKSSYTEDFVDRWNHFCSDLHMIDDSPSRIPNYPEFRENRADQSVWSLLTKLANISAHPDVTWPVETATMIAATRRSDVDQLALIVRIARQRLQNMPVV